MKATKFLAGILTVGAIALAGSLVTPTTAFADPAHDGSKDNTKKVEPSKKDKGDKKEGKKEEKGEKAAAGAAVGSAAPAFTLKDVNDKEVKLSDYKGKIVVLEWYNPECPAIVQHHKTAKTFNDMHTAYKGKDVVILAINSSAQGQQGHGKELNEKSVKDYGIEYPVLLDEDGTVGHAYGATNTPQCYVIDKDGNLAYKGAVDNGKFGKNGDKNYVTQAVDQLLKGEKVTEAETKAYGCNVKYKKS